MTQQDDGVRDIGSPFRMFSPGDPAAVFDVDFHPQAVRVEDLHPSEVADDPKDEAPSSALESAEGSSTLEKLTPVVTPESLASVEKASQVPGLEDLGSPDETSPGGDVPPVPTPPQPPAPTRSSRSAGKSS